MGFEAFDEIQRFLTQCTISEKIHGTNAQVNIFEYTSTDGQKHEPRLQAIAGSRTREVTPEDDNYGFARWVHDNKEALIALLGPGRHFGEWFGSGINHGYGLAKGEKRFALFNTYRWGKVDLSTVPGLTVVPILYQGPYREGLVTEVAAKLLETGSQAAPGCKIPEGVVIRFDKNGVLFKHVFKPEESAHAGKPVKAPKDQGPPVDETALNALLQPVRLEKLLSRDERYVREYPKSLGDIAKDYLADLEKESQLAGVANDVQKALRRRVFGWVKQDMETRGYAT